MMILMFSILNAVVFAALSSFVPWLTRPDLFFARTVPTGFRGTEPAKPIILRYLLTGWFGTILVLALLPVVSQSVMQLSLLALIAVWLSAFFIGRRLAKPYAVAPSGTREAILSARQERFPGGYLVLAGPFVIFAARAVEIYVRWDRIPNSFPIHWGLDGPDRWATKSFSSVYGLLFAMALITGTFIGMGWATLFSSRRVSAAGSNAEVEGRFRSLGTLGLVVLAYVFALTLPPMPGMTLAIPFGPIPLLAAVLVFLVLIAMSGQGGTRLSGYQPAITAGAPVGDGTTDSHWKLGMFYYNPSDPALMVEKRFGLGWTFNFANRWCWVVMGSIALIPVLMHFVIR